MKKNRLIHLLLIFPMILLAQSKVITGTVIDENKMPLPGVSISIKELKIGSFTDFNGLFSLKVPETGKTLVVSYLGYISKELAIGNKGVFNIQLEIDSNTLDEIVVVGYGTQRKSDITGSVASVKVDDIAERILTLQGKPPHTFTDYIKRASVPVVKIFLMMQRV